MQPMQSEISRSFNSFSGSDIRAMIGPYAFAELQAVSYSITREKSPIYTMGSPDPRAFSRNKRGIAGSLIWMNFDRHGLLEVFRKAGGTFIANADDVYPSYHTSQNQPYLASGTFLSGLVRDSGVPASATVDQQQLATPDAGGWKEQVAPWYSDQILPFDITLNGCSENGACTSMKLYGVEILNEGSGTSIDDAVQEMQATFVARALEPWQAVATPFTGTFSQS